MVIAMENGCRLITHLFSCTSTISRDKGFRRLGVIETAMLRDDIYAEIIADGKHVPPDLIRLIIKIKGSDNIALVTDSLSPTGSNIQRGVLTDSTEFIIEDGVCKLPDRSAFAGSIATADMMIRVMTKEVGFSLAETVKMLTKIPARIMGLNKGELKSGFDADVVVFDENINIKSCFVGGKKVV